MKKKNMGKRKAEKRWDRKEEVLDLKELMDVQGGVEKEMDDKKDTCVSLGCYTLRLPLVEDSMEKHDEK